MSDSFLLVRIQALNGVASLYGVVSLSACCLRLRACAEKQQDLEEIDQALHRSLAVALPSMTDVEMRGVVCCCLHARLCELSSYIASSVAAVAVCGVCVYVYVCVCYVCMYVCMCVCVHM